MKKKTIKKFLKKLVACKGYEKLEGRYKLVKKVPFTFTCGNFSDLFYKITYGYSNKPHAKEMKSNSYTLNFQEIVVPKKHLLEQDTLFATKSPNECNYGINHLGQAFIDIKTNKVINGSGDQTNGRINLSAYK